MRAPRSSVRYEHKSALSRIHLSGPFVWIRGRGTWLDSYCCRCALIRRREDFEDRRNCVPPRHHCQNNNVQAISVAYLGATRLL